MNREKIIKGLEFTKAMITFNPSTGEDIEPGNLNEADKTTYDACVGAIALLKEQEELLRKLQKDKDKLCLDVSKWKHKFHDAPPKFVSQGVVDQIRWERDTALSQLEEIGKGLGEKMDDIVALLKEQEAMKECLKKKCVICPHCANCDVDENGLLKEQEEMLVEYSAFGGMKYGGCPRCNARIDNLVNPKACGFCGQELKWE